MRCPIYCYDLWGSIPQSAYASPYIVVGEAFSVDIVMPHLPMALFGALDAIGLIKGEHVAKLRFHHMLRLPWLVVLWCWSTPAIWGRPPVPQSNYLVKMGKKQVGRGSIIPHKITSVSNCWFPTYLGSPLRSCIWEYFTSYFGTFVCEGRSVEYN